MNPLDASAILCRNQKRYQGMQKRKSYKEITNELHLPYKKSRHHISRKIQAL